MGRKLRIFTGDEHHFHDRPLEPYVMPPRQVREIRSRDSVYNLCNLGHKVKTNVAFDSVLGHPFHDLFYFIPFGSLIRSNTKNVLQHYFLYINFCISLICRN